MPPEDKRWREIDAKLPPNDHARIVQRQVSQLNRESLDRFYKGLGKQAYDPLCLLKMVLYQYFKGRLSPATWHQETCINQAMQWLGNGYTPARRTWYNFRDRVGGFIQELNDQLVQLAIDQDLLVPTTLAQDGTSVAACASRHQMLTQPTLNKRQHILQEIVDEPQTQTQPLPKWVPPTPTGRQALAQRMTIAAEVLAERIAKNATKPKEKRKDPAKIYVSLTDPIAPLGRDKLKVFRPLYTIQCLVDPTSHLVASYCCKASASDAGTLAPMIDKTQGIVNGRLRTILADGGYCSIGDLGEAAARNVELLAPASLSGCARVSKARNGDAQIPRGEFLYDQSSNSYKCPAGHTLRFKDREKKARQGDRHLYQSRYQCEQSKCDSCPLMDRCLSGKSARTLRRLEGEELLEAQRTKMQSEEVKLRYSLRGQSVERTFADAKGHRQFHRFHGRGLDRATTETGLLILSLNLLRLDNLQQKTKKTNQNQIE
jgi:transposase